MIGIRELHYKPWRERETEEQAMTDEGKFVRFVPSITCIHTWQAALSLRIQANPSATHRYCRGFLSVGIFACGLSKTLIFEGYINAMSALYPIGRPESLRTPSCAAPPKKIKLLGKR